MLGSLVATVICLRFLGTLTRQVDLMVPRAAMQREVGAVKAANAAWRSDRQSAAIVAQLSVLAERDPSGEEIARWRELPEGSLAAWGEMLAALRQAGVPAIGGPATRPAAPATRPASNNNLARLLAGMEFAQPLRVGLSRVHDRWLAAAETEGLSVRRAEAIFHWERCRPPLSAYRPVLRELSGRLRGLAEAYEQAGRPTEAALAYRVAIRGLTDAVADSPQPEVALLAAAELEPIVGRLERLQGAGPSGAGDALARLRAGWMEIPAGEIGLMPALFGPSLAASEERAALASLTVAAGLLMCAWLFAAFCLILLIVVGFTRPRAERARARSGGTGVDSSAFLPAWRWGAAGAIVATAIVVLPILALCLFLGSSAVPLIWLTSARSLGAIVFSPFVSILLWLAATRLCLRPARAPQTTTLPRFIVLAGLAVVLAAAIAGVLVPAHGEPWRPPPSIQFFRRAGTLAGIASVFVSAVWMFWAERARRKAGLPFGTWARGALAVASSVLMVLLVSSAVALAANRQRDARHEQAFFRAVGEPIAARLGTGWWNDCFAPSRSLVEP